MWESGGLPSIDEAMSQYDGADRERLLLDLICLDVRFRLARGISVQADLYSQFGEPAVAFAAAEISRLRDLQEDVPSVEIAGPLTSEATVIGDVVADASTLSVSEAIGTSGVEQLSDDGHGREVIGPYTLLQRIGQGGMGSVFMAEQTHPVRRRVALKLIKAGTDSREVIARFEAERQALAMMDHENIAKVFDAGTTEDRRPYFVMELVNGVPITDYCDKFKLSLNERLGLFAQCCKAIQHAHQKGIIHRDIKPSNILVSEQDGAAVVKVIDFGLAKVLSAGALSDDPMFTQFGQILGTLRYMSPEQAELNTVDIDTRTDVYSLGVVFYELLTGSTPIQQDRIGKMPLDRVLAAIREEEAPRPSSRLGSLGESASGISLQRQTNPRRLGLIMKGDLDWIAMKALEKDRTRRYDSPAQMAEDVQRYLQSEPIIARPPSFAYRLKKVTRRHRFAVVTAASTLALLIVGIVATSTQMLRAQKAETATGLKAEEARQEAGKARAAEATANQERDNARTAEEAAVKAAALTEKTLARANYYLAIDRWEDNLAADAIGYLEKVPDAHRHFEWHLARNEFEGSELTLYGHTGKVGCVEFSPDGSTIASAGSDGTTKLWNATSGAEIVTFRQRMSMGAIRFSPDGQRLAGILAGMNGDSLVVVLDASTGNKVREFAMGQYTDGEARWSTGSDELDWSPDGLTLVTPGKGSTVKLWNVETGEEVRTLIGHKTMFVTSVAFSRDGKLVISGSRDGSATVWDVASGNAIINVKPAGKVLAVTCVAFSPDGKRLACATIDGRVGIWNVGTGELQIQWVAHSKAVEQCRFSPDGVTIATASQDGTIKLWDVATNKEMSTFAGHQGGVNSIGFIADGRRLASASTDGTVKIWGMTDPRRFPMPAENSSPIYPVSSLSYRADGRQLACSGSGHVVLYDPVTGQLIGTKSTPNMSGVILSVSFSPKGSQLAAGDTSGVIRLWDAETTNVPVTLRGHEDAVFSLDFSSDGRLLASGSLDDSARIWSLADRKELHKLGGPIESERLLNKDGSVAGHLHGVLDVMFSHDWRQLATIGGEGSIILWDAKSGSRIRSIDPAFGTISVEQSRRLRFSPDGRYLVSNKSQQSLDNTIPIWDAATGKETARTQGATDLILSIAVSPDSSRIAAGSRDRSIRIWDSETGELLRRCDGNSESVTALEFSPGGSQIASANADATIQFWNAFPEYEVTTFRGHNKPVACVAISPDGRWILSGSADTTMKLWDASTGQLVRTVEAYPDSLRSVSAVKISADGTRAISAGWMVSTNAKDLNSDVVKLWDLTTGSQLPLAVVNEGDDGPTSQPPLTPGHYFARTAIMTAITFSPDSLRLVTIAPNTKLHICDAQNGAKLLTLPEFNSLISTTAFSSLGDRLVVKTADGEVTAWDVKNGASLPLNEADLDLVSSTVSADSTPDGRWQVLPRANDVLLVDRHFKLSEREQRRRESLAAPKVHWHEQQRARAIRSQNEHADEFHASWLKRYLHGANEAPRSAIRRQRLTATELEKANQADFLTEFPESSLRLLKADTLDFKAPFKRFNEMYFEDGRAIIRSDGGWWAWNLSTLDENQVLRAKVRVRHEASGRVGLCLSQEGGRNGAVVWLSGDQYVARAASVFAENKPISLAREFYAPEIVNPVEEWNEVQCVMQSGLLHIFVNNMHIDTMEFSPTVPRTPASVSFAIQSSTVGTMVEMDEYSILELAEASWGPNWPDDAPKPAIGVFDSNQATQHQQEWATFLGIPVEFTNSIGMKFRLIPPGEFLMGSSEQQITANLKLVAQDDAHSRNCMSSEAPQHVVRLTKPYYLSVHEVTQRQYREVMGSNPSHFSASGVGRDAVGDIETSNFPVETVNYDDAVEFMKKLEELELAGTPEVTFWSHYRLPSEAEWEFAARAGNSENTSGSQQASDAPASRQFMNSEGRTGPVGEFSSNPFGLHDTLGNVWEWCGDSWATDDFIGLQLKVTVDPVRPPTAPGMRLTKGGSWRDTQLFCRPADRHSAGDDFRYYAVGFRPLLEVKYREAKTREAEAHADSRPQK
jgi:WD40 repeat protein/serine/threonine protein kinase/formylglycine-generating enzyme required for sulfatase activity